MRMIMRRISFTRVFTVLAFVALTCIVNIGKAQNDNIYMDVATSGNIVASDGALFIHPMMDANNAMYKDDAAYDYNLVVTDTCGSDLTLCLVVGEFDIDKSDTLYIYDGPNTSSPLLMKTNNSYNRLVVGASIFASPTNTSHCLTLRMKTNGDGRVGRGFHLSLMCDRPCNVVVPHIDSIYYKIRDGVVVDSSKIEVGMMFDTLWNNDSSAYTLDTTRFRAINLCMGDELRVRAYGEYIQTSDQTEPSPEPDKLSFFHWQMGNGDTTPSRQGGVTADVKYNAIDCYDINLAITDEFGCKSGSYESVRVRLAQMPIKTIYALATICNVDSILVNVGYAGENSTITLKTIEFEQKKSKTNPVRKFIPDGPSCDVLCYDAVVEFTDFPAGRTVMSKEDICSICINYEHTFLGDYSLSIYCPTANEQTGHGIALLKQGKPGGGSGEHNGFPLPRTAPYDDSQNKCDSLTNPYGVGLEYCFSRNAAYELVNGHFANYEGPDTNTAFMKNVEEMDGVEYIFPPIPSPFALAGTVPPNYSTYSGQTLPPSDHENQKDYYLPQSDFSSLVGCPLNGTWSIHLCDEWGSDNGWVFSWSLDICGIAAGGGCRYQVGLDSVVWTPDSAYGHWKDNNYVGAIVKNNPDKTTAYILSPDTAGYFPLNVHIIDEFGCVWDTTTSITTVWTPTLELGPDTILCGSESIKIDASDAHTAVSNQSYMWEPYGNTTDTLTTQTYTSSSSTLYTVEVTNEQSNIRCRARDSIRVSVYPQPTPNFDPGIYPLEGCEPFTITFKNTSVGGNKYHWVFGDGDTSNVETPSHTYASGNYGFKYYITSAEGCRDSLVYDQLITVFPSPRARFSWEPINPTVLHPEVHFINNTTPKWDDNKYYWEIQYDKENDVSYHTLRDENPSFKWETDGEDISGTYMARLIAKSRNLGPSGNIIECRDTVENKIVLVNDFLQFPNLVTPNGDGVNDRFVIVNLVNGKGYPNNSLDIYNRWGKRVYHKENISSEDDFWDPAATNAPDGTYYWRFSGKGYLGNIERSGMVEVMGK